jgi:hypothetical protein
MDKSHLSLLVQDQAAATDATQILPSGPVPSQLSDRRCILEPT